MASTTEDLGGAFSSLSGAVVDLFGAKGATASAGSYDEAAAIARQNAAIARQATAIKEEQESRQIFKTIGAQRAQVGGAGFAESGSALDLLSDSASQGALTKALTAEQGAISENSYAEQAGLYSGLARSTRASGGAMAVGGLLQAAGGAISLYSAADKAGIFASAGTDVTGAAILDTGITAIGDVAAASEGTDILAAVASAFEFFA
jgi:hypothetical protein